MLLHVLLVSRFQPEVCCNNDNHGTANCKVLTYQLDYRHVARNQHCWHWSRRKVPQLGSGQTGNGKTVINQRSGTGTSVVKRPHGSSSRWNWSTWRETDPVHHQQGGGILHGWCDPSLYHLSPDDGLTSPLWRTGAEAGFGIEYRQFELRKSLLAKQRCRPQFSKR